jgi:hypothetical protein
MLRRSELVRRTAHGSPFSPDRMLRFGCERQPAYSSDFLVAASFLLVPLALERKRVGVRSREKIVTPMTLRTLGLYHRGIVEPRVGWLNLVNSD